MGTIAMCGIPALAQENSWEIGPRRLPPPVDVSEVFYESVANTPTPDLETALMVPSTDAEWIALATQRDAESEVVARGLAEALGVQVTDEQIAGVSVHRVVPPEIDAAHEGHLFVYIHGGGYVFNAGRAGTIEAVVIAAHLKMPVISIDYRMPPADPAPAAIDDVVAVWGELLTEHSHSSMAMGGTSAGGNITLAAVHRLKDLGLPVPGALYVGTPSVDLGLTGDSRFLNEGVDRILLTWRGFGEAAVKLYAGELGLEHHYVSSIHGDFSEFPPSYLISGTRDLLLSDTVRAHRALRRAGVEADLHVYEGQAHADYIVVMNAPESHEHYAELNAFLLKHLQSVLPDAVAADEMLQGVEIPRSVVR
jgi:acetyl esterase/lipase